MQKKLKRMTWRYRQQIMAAGWSLAGFLIIFCLLTIQLSATEGQSRGRRLPARIAPATPQAASTHLSTRTASADDVYSTGIPTKLIGFRNSGGGAAIDNITHRVESLMGIPEVDSGMPFEMTPKSVTPSTGSETPVAPMFHAPSYVPAGQQLNHFDEIDVQPLSQASPRTDFFGVDMEQLPDGRASFGGLELTPVRTARQLDRASFR